MYSDDDLLAIASEQGLELTGPSSKGKGVGLGNDPEVEPIKENVRPEEKGLQDGATPTVTPTTTSDSHVIEKYVCLLCVTFEPFLHHNLSVSRIVFLFMFMYLCMY